MLTNTIASTLDSLSYLFSFLIH